MTDSKYEDRLFEIILDMQANEQQKLLFELENSGPTRKHPRTECLIRVDYFVKDRAYQSYIQDISMEGVSIDAGESLSCGDELLLTISYSTAVKPFTITGEVVRIDSDGVGVKFKNFSQLHEKMIKSIINKTVEDKKKMS